MSTPIQCAANRINSLKSTGPKSAEGKAASSQNNLRHGFRGKFQLFASEDRAEYDELLESLRQEHQPSGVTEDLIVQRMSEHFWLARRAQAFQYNAAEITRDGDVTTKEFNEAMALWTRYETTHERAFFKWPERAEQTQGRAPQTGTSGPDWLRTAKTGRSQREAQTGAPRSAASSEA
jgi:hypothetical protein